MSALLSARLLRRNFSVAVLCAASIAVSSVAIAKAISPSSKLGRVVAMYRLSEDQYLRTIADIFGADIEVSGRFEPGIRENGLLAVGAGDATISSTGLEIYSGMAETVAKQVLDKSHRNLFVPCQPTKPFDSGCAEKFIQNIGERLFRRPLTEAETAGYLEIAQKSSETIGDFYVGLGNTLATMLDDPNFLFRVEYADKARRRGQSRLDAYSKASRLSYWLWNSTPDEDLLEAAKTGKLNTEAGLTAEVDRMLASPKLEGGVRAFFSDMLGFDAFETVSKDAQLFPKYTSDISRQTQEQTLRTIVDELLVQQGDYRELFTTRKTFLTRQLGALYNVPVVVHRENGIPGDVWVEHVYAEGDPRIGLLAHASLTALHSHSGRTSPTLRGKAIRELLLCQKVPAPPGNVDFSLLQDKEAAAQENLVTLRDKLTAHSREPMCAGCHKITDPIGLTLERFDGGGSYRNLDNNVPIDSSGEYNGTKVSGAASLGAALAKDPAVSNCFVNKAYSYASGRNSAAQSRSLVTSLEKRFAEEGFRLVPLLREIALSPDFFSASGTAASDR